jgi:hypothetical protein
MRESWTDQRLDDFAAHNDRRFDAVDAEIRDLRTEMSARFEKVDLRFEKIDARFERLDARFEALHRLMLQSSVLVIVALIATQL